MTQNLPATRNEDAALVIAGSDEPVTAEHDPQHQEVQQNIAAGLIPLALVVLLLVLFIAAAWTFLAAQPA
jgi:hypothetical protein